MNKKTTELTNEDVIISVNFVCSRFNIYFQYKIQEFLKSHIIEPTSSNSNLKYDVTHIILEILFFSREGSTYTTLNLLRTAIAYSVSLLKFF